MFFFDPRMTAYDFGPKHPLRPERLLRTVALLKHMDPGFVVTDPGIAADADLLRVHSAEYVGVVRALSEGGRVGESLMESSGFWSGDNPPFAGMYEAALAYCGGAVRAAEHVRGGGRLAFNMAGGLHHARRSQASGFCIFNDCAIACSVLRERFERVAYVDIDLHHGDGVQWIFFDDPSVLTCSIHESGRFLYPGTGFVEETGANYTAVNVPLAPRTTGDTWLWAFEEGILPAIEAFEPGAIVLQMGADPHFRDPLGHLEIAAQEWLRAVSLVQSLGLPIVALGGGGYDMTTVPRMWAAAVMTLSGKDVPATLPMEDLDVLLSLSNDLEMSVGQIVPDGSVFDPLLPEPRGQGRQDAEKTVALLKANVLPHVPRPRSH